jgi:1-acyl-sn-glycerol-3-phosphate acyltransferase
MSFWDPIVIAAVVARKIHYMAKEELFEHILLARLFRTLNAFPVKRGAPDRRALKTGLELLAEQKVLGIFPEGTRSKTGELSKPQHGIAMLASPVVVKIGPPVRYEEYYGSKLSTSVLEEVSRDIMDKISLLKSS